MDARVNLAAVAARPRMTSAIARIERSEIRDLPPRIPLRSMRAADRHCFFVIAYA
jgi:hypothetical protein